MAPTVDLLIAARVLQAIGGCVLVPSSLAILTDAYPDRREQAWAIGVWSATTGISTGLGPVIGGALVTLTDWRAVFWINLPFVLAAIWLTVRHVPETAARAGRRLDLPGQVAVLVFLVTLTSAFIESSGSGWTSPAVLALFAVAAISLGAFVAAEVRGDQVLLPPDLFRSPAFSGAAALATIAFVVFAGFLFVNTLYLQEVRGYSAVGAGALMMATTVGNIVLSPLSGRLTADRGARLPILLSAFLLLAGSLTLALSALDGRLSLLLTGYFLIGSGVGLVNAPITVAAVAGMPPERAGVGGAITSTFRQVGNALGVAVLGTLAFTGYARDLPRRVDALGLPPGAAARIVAQARERGASGGLAGHVAGGGPGVSGAIGRAYSTGLEHAYLGAAGLSILAIAIGATCFRGAAGAGVTTGDERLSTT